MVCLIIPYIINSSTVVFYYKSFIRVKLFKENTKKKKKKDVYCGI